MPHFSTTVHHVTKIELASTMLSNENCHVLRITTNNGVDGDVMIEHTYFGKAASAFSSIPKAKDYKEFI